MILYLIFINEVPYCSEIYFVIKCQRKDFEGAEQMKNLFHNLIPSNFAELLNGVTYIITLALMPTKGKKIWIIATGTACAIVGYLWGTVTHHSVSMPTVYGIIMLLYLFILYNSDHK